jgi:hypothetical protein
MNDEEFQAALRGRDSKDSEGSRNRAEGERRCHLDKLLDQALDASFPASDPTAVGRSS